MMRVATRAGELCVFIYRNKGLQTAIAVRAALEVAIDHWDDEDTKRWGEVAKEGLLQLMAEPKKD